MLIFITMKNKNNKFVEKQFDIFLKMVAEKGFEPSRPKGGAL